MKKFKESALLLMLFNLLFYGYTFSQESTGKDHYILQGKVVEKENGIGIPYVTVRAFDSKNNSVTAVSSDDKGRYTVTLKKRGIYILKYYSMGFSEDSLYTNVTEPGILKLSDIRLSSGQLLTEVRVVANRSLITQEVDKLIYDVSLDPDARKLKMSDIMLKIPHMQHKIEDGNLRYLDENISTIYINGERNDLISGSRQYPMSFIRGDVMSKIEVIMPNTGENKTDKYIVNIKLAREIPNGVAFQNTFSANTRNRYRGSSDIASKTGNLYYSLNYGISYEDSPKLRSFTEKEYKQNSLNYLQRDTSYSWNNNLAHNLILGLGTSISKKHTFYLNLSAQKSDNESNYQLSSGKYDITRQQTGYSNNRTINTVKGIPRLNVQASYSGFGAELNFASTNTHSNNIRDVNSLLSNETLISNINTISGSKSKKVNENLRFWFFASYSNRAYSQNSELTGLDYYSNLINTLFNTQFINKDYSVNINIRLNNEYIKGVFYNFGTESNLDYSKLRLLPELNISYLTKRKYRLNFGFSNSYTRPGLSTLNPFIDQSDPENLIQGNPNLKPEIRNDINFRVRKQMPKLFLGSEFIYGNTRGAIERLTELREDGKSYTTFGNIGIRHNFNLSFNAIYRHNSFRISNNLGFSKNIYIDGSRNLNNSILFLSNATSLSGDITKTTALEFSMNLSPQTRSAQSKDIKYYSIFSLRLNQVLVKNKLYCGVSINDPFNNRRFLYSNIGNDEYRITTNREIIGRIFTFNIRWNFGRFNEKPDGLGRSISTPSDIYVP
jgi:hypothetical protein